MSKYLIIFFLLITISGYAQVTISGRIINKNDNKPISNAVAFLNRTDIATTSNNDGRFVLKNITPGHYLLSVTIIGYEHYQMPVTLSGDLHLPDIALSPKNDTLNEVTIKEKPKVQSLYYTFFKDFFGDTQFARECKIRNPGIIHFYNTDPQGNYSAKSNTFIEIENNALGYRIKLLLNFFTKTYKDDRTDYDGQSYFEEMKGTPQQEAVWQKNRLQCYQGSQMQFLRCLLAGTTREQGFLIKRANLKINPYYDPNEQFVDLLNDGKYSYKIKDSLLQEQDIVRKTNRPGLFALVRNNSDTSSCLYIEYRDVKAHRLPSGKKEDRIPWIWSFTDSYILFQQPYTVFDYNGVINTHGNVTFTGFLGEARVANQLPMDYEPTE